MYFQYSNITIASFTTAGIAALIAWTTWRRRSIPGGLTFSLMMLAIFEWTFARAFEAAAVGMPAKILWAKIEYPGIVSVPILWLIFAFQYSRKDAWLVRRNVALLCILPVITLVMVATNEWHGLVWSSITPSPGRETELLVYRHGTWFWIQMIYSYLLMLVGTFKLAQMTFSNYRLYKLQSLSILIAALIPWIGNAIYLSGNSPIPGLDLTPLAFTVSGLVIGWSISRYRLFDLVPMARDSLIEDMDDGVIVLDAQNRIVDINPATKRLFGKTNSLLIGEKADEALEQLSGIVMQKNDSPQFHTEILLGDKYSPLYVDLKISQLYDRYERPIGRLINLQDITERKQTEEDLRDHTRMLENILEKAADGICVCHNIPEEPYVKFTHWNPRMTAITGYTMEEINQLGWYQTMYLDKDVQNRAIERMDKMRSGDDIRAEEWVITAKDGGNVTLLISTSVVSEENGNVHVLALMQDITGRKKSEQALRESEEKYRTVLESNPDPVVVYDVEGKVIYFNPAFTRVFGWSLEERIGKKMDDFVPEENRPETRMMIDKVMVSRENFSGLESRRYTKNGKIIPVSISGALYHGRDGHIISVVLNLRDISEQKKLEAQLQQAQKMESIGTLAGGIAHNFNNILMGMQGRISLILLDKNSAHPDFVHLKGIEDGIRSGGDLTMEILGFARSGKYEVKPTDLNAILCKSADMFGRTKKEVTIHRKVQKDLWIVEVDQPQIEQVLLNLYVNAWQAMTGPGEMYLETENTTLDEHFVKPYNVEPGRYVKMSVTDTGVGMDEAVQQRVFDPFFTTKEMSTGTGLGLASAYGIIRSHGGLINLRSKKGKGTTFNIYLPVSAKETVQEKEFSGEVIKGTETVLLVDDDETIAEVGQELLETLGYTVFPAMSGKEAIEIYKKNKDEIDMVLLDMIMPEMGGSETYDRLKKINPDIKVLLFSGYSIDGLAKAILARGCDGFIQKPFSMVDMSIKLREILDEE